MAWRPTLEEVEAAARVLHEAGLHHHWWEPYRKSYDELAATDAIGKDEFDAIVARMLMAAHAADEEGRSRTVEKSKGTINSAGGGNRTEGDI